MRRLQARAAGASQLGTAVTRPGGGAGGPESSNQHGRCRECGQVGPGWHGPAGSEFESSFFCTPCWESWESAEAEQLCGQKDEEPDDILTPGEVAVAALLKSCSAEEGSTPAKELEELTRKLESRDRAQEIVKELVRFSTAPISVIETELHKHGVPSDSFVADISRERLALLTRLHEVLLWERLPASELRKVCEARQLRVTGKDSHDDLIEVLSASRWEERGIPIRQLPSVTVAIGLLQQIKALEKRSAAELSALLGRKCRGSPLEGQVLSRAGTLRFLRQLVVWEQLTPEALAAWCRDRRLSASAGTERRDGVRGLLQAAATEYLQRQHAMVKRLGGEGAAEEVLQEVRRLEDLENAALKYEYNRHWGLPVEPGIGHEALLERIKQLLVWNYLPQRELLEECRLREVAVPCTGKAMNDEEKRQALVQSLTTDLCVAKWEALGIPARRLGPLQNSVEVIKGWDWLERLTDAGLRQEFEKMPSQLASNGLPPTELKKCLRSFIVWSHMPLRQLQAECQAARPPLVVAPLARGGEEEQRAHLACRLVEALYTGLQHEARGVPAQRLRSAEAAVALLSCFRRLEALDRDALMAEYQRFGLPWTAVSTADLLARVKAISLWQELSSEELQKECQRRRVEGFAARGSKQPLRGKGIPRAAGIDTDVDRQELTERLLLQFGESLYTVKGIPSRQLGSVQACERVRACFSRLNKLSLEELAQEHWTLNLPRPAGALRGAYLEDLRQHAVWAETPLAALRRVCQDAGVLSSTDPQEPEEVAQRELVRRLLAAARVRRHEEHGVPVRRLEPEAAARLLERFLALETLTRDDLVEECLRCGLPPPPSRGDRALLLQQLKWALTAQELPFVEFRKECVGVGVKGFHSAPESCRPQMLERMLAAAWDASTASKEDRSGGGGKTPVAAIAKSLRTLDLPDNAELDDVKRAYRKLALKYHPDKHLSTTSEDSSAQFQEIVAAYEAMVKHFADAAYD